ncbi:MAG: hypothetical protein LBE13_11700 [Bacteroidales bacterium]|nr:hypothetical protein [Bacteroidales bacterium]
MSDFFAGCLSLSYNDYNLNIPLYVEKEILDNLLSLEEAMANLKVAVAESKAAEQRLKELLKEYL